MKIDKDDLYKLDAVEIYKMVLNKEIKIFPKNFWRGPSAINNAYKCTKYMIEHILQWNEEDIKQKLTTKVFEKNKLRSMLNYVYKASPYLAIDAIYPNKFCPWEFKQCPQDFWTKETSRVAIKWLIEEKLKWNDNDIKENLDNDIFINNGFSRIISFIYNGSPYEAINDTYPDRFKPWELKTVPRNYWNIETARQSIRWLIEEKLQWNDNDIKRKLTQQLFKDNGLAYMLRNFYNNIVSEAINDVYFNKFKIDGFKR